MPPAKKGGKPQPAAKPIPVTKGDLAAELQAELAKMAPVHLGSSDEISIHIPGVISTRCATLDAAIGRGGLPMSRLTVLAGGEGVGKTTIALHTAAETQARGGIALYIDAEHKLDLDYAAKLGVDLKKLLLIQPAGLEGALEMIAKGVKGAMARAPEKPVLCVLDSINAERTADEYESESYTVAGGGLASQARAMSYGLPKLLRELGGSRTVLLFISQPREGGFGSGRSYRENVAGGNAPKHYAAVVIGLRRDTWLKESEKEVGSIVKARIDKNQVAVPFKEGLFSIRWGVGIDYQQSLIERGIQLGLLNRGDSGWHEMPWEGSDKPIKWQGMRAWNKLVATRPELVKYLEDKAYEAFR